MFHRPWVDKYRPKKIDDIMEQNEIRDMLKNTLDTKNLPHMIFYGPAGCGKTTCAIALALELYGKNVNENVIELNASDERGINVVREKITNFAKSKMCHNDDMPHYKLIILDEADAMTIDAQSALRKIMETYAYNTRFCLICNYINQIIQPIISRCMKFRFKPLNLVSLNKRLKFISKNEHMQVSDDIINLCSTISQGDARKAIMFLQSLNYHKNITKELVYDLANEVSVDLVKNIIFQSSKNILDVVKNVKRNGYSIKNIMEKLNDYIIHNSYYNDNIKAKLCMKLSVYIQRLMDGGSEELQLINALYLFQMR